MALQDFSIFQDCSCNPWDLFLSFVMIQTKQGGQEDLKLTCRLPVCQLPWSQSGEKPLTLWTSLWVHWALWEWAQKDEWNLRLEKIYALLNSGKITRMSRFVFFSIIEDNLVILFYLKIKNQTIYVHNLLLWQKSVIKLKSKLTQELWRCSRFEFIDIRSPKMLHDLSHLLHEGPSPFPTSHLLILHQETEK